MRSHPLTRPRAFQPPCKPRPAAASVPHEFALRAKSWGPPRAYKERSGPPRWSLCCEAGDHTRGPRYFLVKKMLGWVVGVSSSHPPGVGGSTALYHPGIAAAQQTFHHPSPPAGAPLGGGEPAEGRGSAARSGEGTAPAENGGQRGGAEERARGHRTFPGARDKLVESRLNGV